MTPVTVDIRKYDGRCSARWSARRLGADDHGTWLATAEGVRVSSADGGWVTRFPYVMLVPEDAWWTATFCRPPGPEVYCDVCTPAQWSADGTEVRMVDLDLDVVRLRGVPPHIEDEEEFAAHRLRFGYPDEVVAEARKACARLYAAVRRESGAALFTSVYPSWLARAERTHGT
ncbi:DUF402 domain-containing protein [Streptomyces sp. TRM66268-LWL]|uniref:DUF402 domain-containing protein n=1 Tax=Streptomyces polyasparticus TaxID=2767826 RepID=A0ABR7SL09_9ACTN|nr:DUF402 domain-containing protein [Streptomyces polyasparticus]MBC9715181.1 DUF402 domain-containing protein [Streptomyces polyasparticus]